MTFMYSGKSQSSAENDVCGNWMFLPLLQSACCKELHEKREEYRRPIDP